MQEDIQALWKEAKKVFESELTEIALNMWFSKIDPVSIKDDVVTFIITDNFSKGIIEERYGQLIKGVLNSITDKNYSLRFIVNSDENLRILSEEIEEEAREKDFYEELDTIEETPTTDSTLNSKYTFDSFVVGNSNRLAHAASLAVAQSPAKAYNPMFIYGGVGLGKTHLMHAIGHYVQRSKKGKKVVYVSSETFTNDLINSIRDRSNAQFRDRYRNVDVLLVDDIQFIAGKEQTQEEFFHTFNALHQSNKQIVLSSDRPPKDIPTLEERLRSRFEMGLITDIQAPDLETRIAILRKKAKDENLIVPNEIMLFMAKSIQSNIRELEGALTRLTAYASFSNKELNIDLAREALKDIISQTKPRIINSSLIKETVSDYYGIKKEEFDSKKRSRNISFPRQVAMYLCRELTDMSLPKIGEDFGGRDHSTVLHAYDKITEELETDENLKLVIAQIKSRITGD